MEQQARDGSDDSDAVADAEAPQGEASGGLAAE